MARDPDDGMNGDDSGSLPQIRDIRVAAVCLR